MGPSEVFLRGFEAFVMVWMVTLIKPLKMLSRTTPHSPSRVAHGPGIVCFIYCTIPGPPKMRHFQGSTSDPNRPSGPAGGSNCQAGPFRLATIILQTHQEGLDSTAPTPTDTCQTAISPEPEGCLRAKLKWLHVSLFLPQTQCMVVDYTNTNKRATLLIWNVCLVQHHVFLACQPPFWSKSVGEKLSKNNKMKQEGWF